MADVPAFRILTLDTLLRDSERARTVDDRAVGRLAFRREWARLVAEVRGENAGMVAARVERVT